MTRFWRVVLVFSLAINVAGVAVVLLKWGPRDIAVRLDLVEPAPAERLDYASRAEMRFEGLPGEDTVILGDSLVELGEWTEVLAEPVANRGLFGATVAEVPSWTPQALNRNEDRVIVWAGTNDVLVGQLAGFEDRYATLLATVQAAAPDASLVVLTVPPLDWVAGDVDAANEAIRTAADDAGAVVVDVTEAVDGQRWDDAVHIRPSGYEALASLLEAP